VLAEERSTRHLVAVFQLVASAIPAMVAAAVVHFDHSDGSVRTRYLFHLSHLWVVVWLAVVVVVVVVVLAAVPASTPDIVLAKCCCSGMLEFVHWALRAECMGQSPTVAVTAADVEDKAGMVLEEAVDHRPNLAKAEVPDRRLGHWESTGPEILAAAVLVVAAAGRTASARRKQDAPTGTAFH